MNTSIQNPESIDKNDIIKQAHQKAPATLFLSAVGGIIGAWKGGSKGALVGLGTGGAIGYFIDNLNTSPNTNKN
jgi:hypothetical protein